MKTIATAAAFFLTLTASAWADELEQTQFALLKHAGEPIVLSEAEMVGVTAGYSSYWDAGFVTLDVSDPASSRTITTGFKAGKALKDAVN